MGKAKENNVWLIPFSRDEVKLWDRLINKYWIYVWRYRWEFIFRNLDQRYIDVDRYVIAEKNCWYIDRRSKIKRLIDNICNLLELTI